MPIYLPDTNVFSAYAKGSDAALVAKVNATKQDILLSVVALAEMEYGWRKAGKSTHRISRQQGLVSQLTPIVFDEVCAKAYGAIKTFLFHARKSTHGNTNPIGERDMLIAAQAAVMGAVLVTHNTREFTEVPGLIVEDWQTVD